MPMAMATYATVRRGITWGPYKVLKGRRAPWVFKAFKGRRVRRARMEPKAFKDHKEYRVFKAV